MQVKSTKKRPKSPFLLLAEEDRSNERRELFVGIGVRKLCPPALVEFHETGMGLVSKDELSITAGLLPIAALGFFTGGKGMFFVVPFALDKDFIGTDADNFSRDGVMEVLLFGNCDLMNALRSCFLESAGDADDTELCCKMCHVTKGNN